MAPSTRSNPNDAIGVPTNVITGFLGAGKSTAIMHLLRHKPADERWAVLVNEFGEIGIDGNLLAGNESEQQGVFVKAVPGGCMCCSAGVPMQIAMHMLLAQARPDRLLIEPTGLGHPEEFLDLLGSHDYRETIDLRATITLVDPRKLAEPRYTEHETFAQQLAMADLVVANKADLCNATDLAELDRYLKRTAELRDKPVFEVEQGALQMDWLDAPARRREPTLSPHPLSSGSQLPNAPQIPESGYLRIDNEGEGFFSQGWMFDPSWTFDQSKLEALLHGIDAERAKAVFVTDRGITAYNMADGVLTQSALRESPDSRIEILSADRRTFDGLERALLDCVISPTKA